MEEFIFWNLSVIHAVQQAAHPVITHAVVLFTFFGGKGIALCSLWVLWCVEYRKGLAIAYALACSEGLNYALKGLLRVPRPFVRDPSVKLVFHDGFSTPSGHAQASALFVLLARSYPSAKTPVPCFCAPGCGTDRQVGDRENPSSYGQERTPLARTAWTGVAGVLFVGVIGLSRVYLGVHYPIDVLLGWLNAVLFGALILGMRRALRRGVVFFTRIQEVSGRSFAGLRFSAVVCIALLLAVGGADVSMCGAFCGLGAGHLFIFDRWVTRRAPAGGVGFHAAGGSFTQKVVRFCVGCVFCSVVSSALHALFSGAPAEYARLLRFVRYGIGASLSTGVVPLLFLRVGLEIGRAHV